MAGLFATKPLDKIIAEANETGEHSLRRALGPFHLIAIGIGSIIGTGIFVLTGTAAAHHAGPAILLSFILAAIACTFAGLCYAEFASMIPVAGSAYTYGYATLGEFIAWMIGWDLILEYALGAATVASGWSGYILSFLQDFGILLPPKLAGAPGTAFVLYHGHWERLTAQLQTALALAHIDSAGLPQQYSSFNLFGFLGILFFTAILVIGIKESVTLTSLVVVVKICVLLVFIGIGANYISEHRAEAVANWTPFLPSNTGHYGDFGWSGIATAAGVIFFAFIGFDQVSTAAQESRNPVRDLPIGILGSLAICTVIYILVAGVLTGLVKYTSLDAPAPIAFAIEGTGVRWGSTLVKLGAICGLSSAMVVTLLGQSRIFFSMSHDGLLPRWASAVHPRFRTPYISTILVGVCVALVASLTPISVMSELVSIGTLLAFVIVCGGVWILRRRRTEVPRAFVTPWIPFTPIMGIAVSLLMMLSLGWETWARLIIWLAVGVILYFGYGRKHSKVQRLSAAERSLK
ncbi:MAG TPA: amino acid permease [Candidatus Sulfotelmatobacter sp.]|jgi:APA family basic amino acid/polyamine antiporter|nr:amino acid permease [Candidatus Sulfotelmatobacter sp.]